MKSNKQLVSFIIVSVLILGAFNVIAFVVPFNRTPTYWIGYAVTMLAIVVAFASSFYAFRGDRRSKFYGFPLISLAWAYLITQTIIGIVLMAASMIPMFVALIVCVLVFAGFIIGMIAADNARDVIEDIDTRVKQKTFFIKSLQLDMKDLMSGVSDPELSKALKDLSDEIAYSDPASVEQVSSVENRIENGMMDLKSLVESGETNAAVSKANEVKKLVIQRNDKLKLLK